MDPSELYAFDLNGYLLIDDAVPGALLDEVDTVVDGLCRRAGVHPLPEPLAPGAAGGTAKLINIVLEHEVFLRVAMSPAVIARIPHLVIYPRLKSTWVQLNGVNRGINHHANHTPHDPVDMYWFQGRVCANLVTVMYAFCDIPEDGGALEVIPGSHKANFPLPKDPRTLARLRRRLPLKRGQALLFSHDLNHGSHNARNYVRRSLFTSFSPGSSAHTLGDNDLYDRLFDASPDGSWQKYLLRRPRGDRDTHPQPTHALADEPAMGLVASGIRGEAPALVL